MRLVDSTCITRGASFKVEGDRGAGSDICHGLIGNLECRRSGEDIYRAARSGRAWRLWHSLGGATTTLTCSIDTRCKAGTNEDGPVFGDMIEQGLDQPFLYLLSHNSLQFANPDFYSEARGPFYEVSIQRL